MQSPKKLSIFLNGCYTYEKLSAVNTDDIYSITDAYLQKAREDIFRQPVIALRSIKIEMQDIFNHFEELTKGLERQNDALHGIIVEGPRISPEKLERVKDFESRRDVLSEFVISVEASLGSMMRMLLEHYSEQEIGKPFLDKFSRFLGRFDWLGKRVNYYSKKDARQNGIGLEQPLFAEDTRSEAIRLIADNKIMHAIELLLPNTQVPDVEENLIELRRRWIELDEKKILGLVTEEFSEVSRAKMVKAILSMLRI